MKQLTKCNLTLSLTLFKIKTTNRHYEILNNRIFL